MLLLVEWSGRCLLLDLMILVVGRISSACDKIDNLTALCVIQVLRLWLLSL